MLPNQTLEMLRFLALSQSEKMRYLPADADGLCYVTADGEAEIAFAAEAAVRAAFKAVDSAAVDGPAAIKPLLLEIRCVMEMMLDLAERVDYVWLLDKEKHPISGPYDDAWLVLKRLATQALQQAGRDASSPTVMFADLLKFAGFQSAIRRGSASE